MGIFSFWKKDVPEDVPAGTFSFRIDDIFRIKGHGLVVTGQMTAGEVACGSTVTCVKTDGSRSSCVIQRIEQPKPGGARGEFIHPDRASADGPFQGSYAFWVGDRDPKDFHPGDRLVSGNE